jgi:ribosomal protein S17E
MKDSIIEKQIQIIQDILSNLAESSFEDKKDFRLKTKDYFGFQNDFDRNILLNAFYVFEDTELAKRDFVKFGLQGPARHDNLGEKYLRLYGILNGVYQQYLGLINLVELFKLNDKKELIEKLKNCTCIELRNKIASHPTNYINDNKSLDVYEISQHDLESGRIKLCKNQEHFEVYDLNNAISEFNSIIEETFSRILKKFLKKRFNNAGKYYAKFEKLESIRKGDIIIGNSKITFKNN